MECLVWNSKNALNCKPREELLRIKPTQYQMINNFTIDMGIYIPKASIGDFFGMMSIEMESKMRMSRVLQMLK